VTLQPRPKKVKRRCNDEKTDPFKRLHPKLAVPAFNRIMET
jgi:hypothetical protein